MLIVAAASMSLADADGSPDARTGAPGEQTCAVDCHSSYAVNSGDGSFQILAPATYVPGEGIILTIRLQDPDQVRWGFEITALNDDDEPVGELQIVDPDRTQKSVAVSGREYVKQNFIGHLSDGSAAESEWGVRWMSDVTPVGRVTFYAAGTAGSNSLGPFDDYAYTATLSVLPDQLSCCTGNTMGNIDCTGIIDIGDVTVMIQNLFITLDDPCCEAETDLDFSGLIDIGDLTILISALFITLLPLDPCP